MLYNLKKLKMLEKINSNRFKFIKILYIANPDNKYVNFGQINVNFKLFKDYGEKSGVFKENYDFLDMGEFSKFEKKRLEKKLGSFDIVIFDSNFREDLETENLKFLNEYKNPSLKKLFLSGNFLFVNSESQDFKKYVDKFDCHFLTPLDYHKFFGQLLEYDTCKTFK